MAKKFEDLEVGDQLELPANRNAYIIGCNDGLDPERTCKVAIVTHIWFDPVEAKEFVGLANLRADGTYGKPNEKRTITGLARCGWRKASIDWIARIEASENDTTVVNIWDKKRS